MRQNIYKCILVWQLSNKAADKTDPFIRPRVSPPLHFPDVTKLWEHSECRRSFFSKMLRNTPDKKAKQKSERKRSLDWQTLRYLKMLGHFYDTWKHTIISVGLLDIPRTPLPPNELKYQLIKSWKFCRYWTIIFDHIWAGPIQGGPSENNLIVRGLCFFAPPPELIELLGQDPLHNHNKEKCHLASTSLYVFVQIPFH